MLSFQRRSSPFLIAVIAFLHYPDFAMGSLAADLKTEREKRNTSLAQIAADTRINLHYLESLEEGRYGDLPGGMYNRAFLRAYCESLNLNQPEIMQRYEVEVAAPMDKLPKPRVHIPQNELFAETESYFNLESCAADIGNRDLLQQELDRSRFFALLFS